MTGWKHLPVVWFTLHDEQPARGFWDMATLEDQFARLGAMHDDGPGSLLRAHGGAVVVLPGRMNYGRENEVQEALAGFEWVVLVVTSDEEGGFDHTAVAHPNIERHVQTPTMPLGGARFVPLGSTPHLQTPGRGPDVRPYDWAFLGQHSHHRRTECLSELRLLGGEQAYAGRSGLLGETHLFGAGLPADLYAASLHLARVAPCPSGPVHPETFRMYEALEAGCVPIADARTPAGDWRWWWEENLPDAPFPIIDWWDELPETMGSVLDGWQHRANVCGAWWKRRKLAHGALLVGDAKRLAGRSFRPDLADAVTVIVPVSPIPSHPSTEIVEETIASILDQPGLRGCPVIIACDGVRPEQEDRRSDYDKAVAALVHMAHHRDGWAEVSVVVAEEWLHQARLTQLAMREVVTDTVLFVEQDTPLVGPVPWPWLVQAIRGGGAATIRLHHEVAVLPDHEHLMVGSVVDQLGVPAWRTMQWSQRPHLSSTAWYRAMLDELFPASARTMIEDRLHGVVQDRPWEWAKLWLYTPDGSMKRSTHLDGRAGAQKYDMRFS